MILRELILDKPRTRAISLATVVVAEQFFSQIVVLDKSVALRVTLQNALQQRLCGAVLLVRLLVVLEGSSTRLSLHSLVDLWAYLGLRQAGVDSTATLALVLTLQVLRLLGLLGRLQLVNRVLVVLEVSTVERLQRGNPDGEARPKHLVLRLVREDGVAWVLHEVQVLEGGAFLE